MEVRLLLFLTLFGVVSAKVPPLASLPKSLLQEKKAYLGNPNTFAFNFGLEGAVTQEDWDRATLADAEPPFIIHPNLNGNPDPVTVIGKKMMTIKNRTINAFQGIRFGEPPVGAKRFKKPDPALPYFGVNNTLYANHLGEKCPQRALMGPVGAGSEDCLFLNVYTPYLPSELPNGLLPVMFYVYGGAFVVGDSSLYLPTKLLDHDVVLVVIHYRVGTLGFFSLLTDEAPGNAGLWDQIVAMEWVRDNIEGFGGDPDRVTIFGQSAGSTSVIWQHVLPSAQGLFHGVIGESGSALEHWALDPEPLVSARLVAGRNGCPNDTNTPLQEIFDCMITIPHEELSLNLAAFVSEDRARGEMGFRGASPVIDLGVSNPLITKTAEEYYMDGEVNDVPLIIGANKHEGTFVLGIMYLEYFVPHGYLNDTYYLQNQMIPDILNAFGVSDITNGIGESLKDAYFAGEITDFASVCPGMIDLAGVLFLKAGAWNSAKLHASYLSNKVFFYSFDFPSEDTMFTWFFMGHDDFPFEPGVSHCDEVLYLFPLPAVMEGHQLVIMDRMTALWTNFAIYGDPTPDDNTNWQNLGIPKWEPLTKNDRYYMLMENEYTLKKEYPDRWQIALEESGKGTTPESGRTTFASTEVTTKGPAPNSCEEVENERQAFKVSMIVFIVTTVILGLSSVILCFKKR